MILDFLGKTPRFGRECYISENATVIGDVSCGDDTSIWFNTVLRGDVNWIRIGSRTNIQDHVMVHVTNRAAPTRVGNSVTIGHRAVVHGCRIDDNVLIGMGAIIMDGAHIGSDSIVGAGALVTSGTVIPKGHLAIGSPARVSRILTSEEIDGISRYATNYVRYKNIYLGVEVPDTNPFYVD